jgi:RNA polymerase sigma-70 factor, ECF subfamily
MNTTASDAQDQSDMALLAEGQDAALNDLMGRHKERLFCYLIRVLQDEFEAADVAQAAFVRVYQYRAKFDPKQKFSTWLYAIATNLVKDRFRYRSRHPQVSLDAESPTGGDFRETLAAQSPTPGEHLQAQERAETVRRAIQELPEELRTPLILSEYEELSHAEIGDVLACSAKAVETRIYRARKQLRISLGKLLGLE